MSARWSACFVFRACSRGHVIDGAHHGPGARQLGLGRGVAAGINARQAHVENLHDPFFVQQQVGGLDVPMHDPFAVRELQAPRRLQDIVDRLAYGQGTVFLDQRREVFPLDILHNQEVDTVA